MVAYHEVERVIANAIELLDVRGTLKQSSLRQPTSLTTGSHPSTGFISSGDDTIVSSDSSYDEFSERLAPEDE